MRKDWNFNFRSRISNRKLIKKFKKVQIRPFLNRQVGSKDKCDYSNFLIGQKKSCLNRLFFPCIWLHVSHWKICKQIQTGTQFVWVEFRVSPLDFTWNYRKLYLIEKSSRISHMNRLSVFSNDKLHKSICYFYSGVSNLPLTRF